MATYLGYVHGGKCVNTHGNPKDRIEKQFWVQRELETQGIDSWVGVRVEFIRKGKNRHFESQHHPALPNYIFIDVEPHQFMKLADVKHLAPTFQVIPEQAMANLQAFQNRVQEAYDEAQKVEARDKAAVTAYTQGQALQAISGPYVDAALSFLRLIHDRAGVPFILVKTEMFGREVEVPIDPLLVRAAG